MWALLASIAAVVGTLLQVASALDELARNHAAEIESWNAEAELLDEVRWWRWADRRRRYRQLVEMRTDEEKRVIARVRMVLIGWLCLTLAAMFYLGDQIANFF